MSYGVELTIKKLRPGATFRLNNSFFTKWYDPEGRLPPSWDEIRLQIEKDQKITSRLENEE